MAQDEWIKYLNNQVFLIIVLLASFGFSVWFIYSRWKFYPVNCWFCNLNSKVHFKLRNSWICHHCQQYNGFTSDGDYNQTLYQNMQPNEKVMYNINKFPSRPASNGLCHKCNTNQQLKVMQIANFKPLNENKFDSEVDQFRLHLEEVYKLCKKCKKYLNAKLQNEKGAFLNPRKILSKTMIKTKSLTASVEFFLKNISLKLAYIFLLIIILDIGFNANLFFSRKIIRLAKHHYNSLSNIENYNKLLSESTMTSLQSAKDIISNATIVNVSIDLLNKHIEFEGLTKFLTVEEHRNYAMKLCLEVLVLLHLLIQVITMFVSEMKRFLRIICNTLVWLLSGYLIWNGDKYLLIVQVILSVFFIWNTTASVDKINSNTPNTSVKVWKNMKNLSSSSQTSQCSYEDDDLISEDSDEDDDHTLGRNRTSTPEYLYQNPNYNFSDRSQITRPYGFQINDNHYNQLSGGYNSSVTKSPYNYNLYNFTTELDRGIGRLSLENKDLWSNYGSQTMFTPSSYGSPNSNGRFSLRRPVLSPSKFVYNTQQSWVAGGYWGTESPKKLHPSHDTSRSSSQSSGFESMVSGNYRKNYFTPIGNHNKSDDICDKSVYSNNSLFNANLFLNNNSLPVAKSPRCKTLFDSSTDLNGSRLRNLNISKEYAFLTPNTNKSFIPLDKPT